jgi:hypothetical protein
MNGSKIEGRRLAVKIGQSMFHPIHVISIRTIFRGVGASRFFAIFGTGNRRTRAGQQVFQFQGFHEISIPNEPLVGHHDLGYNLVQLVLAFRQGFGSSVYHRVLLHGESHFHANFRRRSVTGSVSQAIQLGDTLHAFVLLHGGYGIAWFVFLGNF